jgi:hypothetical protein
MHDCIYIKPIFWRLPNKLSNFNVIKIYGYNSLQEKFIISVNTYNTYILKFNISINDTILQEITSSNFIKSYKKLDDFISTNNTIHETYYNDNNIKDYINNNNDNFNNNNFNNNNYVIVRSNKKLSREILCNIYNIDDVIECDDKLKIFWQYNNIGPYNWLKIENYNNKQVNLFINSDNKNIIVDECNISVRNDIISKNVLNTEKLLIWDVRFVDKKILMISIITILNKDVQGYILFNNKFGNRGLIQNKLNNILFFTENTNKNIIKKFIDIVKNFNPYRQLYYSDNNPNLEIFFKKIKLSSKIFKNIELINLYEYYKIFNNYYTIPCFNTFKKYFLKNTYLPTTNQKILENLNSENLNKILVDAYYDSYDIYELIKKEKILQKLENLCNKLECNIYHLHTNNFKNIFPLISHLNITQSCLDGILKPIKNDNHKYGIYKNVYVYDYIEIYRQIMLLSKNKLTQILASKLENAPAKIIYDVFNYIENDMQKFKLFLQYVYENYEIISIDNQYMVLKNKIKSNILKPIDYLKSLVYTKDNNIIRLDNKNNIYSTIHISFILAYDIIGMFLSKKNKKFILPDIKNIEYEKFIITEKNNTNKYIMCDNGSVSVNLINNSLIINYSYYIELLNNYLSLLENL